MHDMKPVAEPAGIPDAVPDSGTLQDKPERKKVVLDPAGGDKFGQRECQPSDRNRSSGLELLTDRQNWPGFIRA